MSDQRKRARALFSPLKAEQLFISNEFYAPLLKPCYDTLAYSKRWRFGSGIPQANYLGPSSPKDTTIHHLLCTLAHIYTHIPFPPFYHPEREKATHTQTHTFGPESKVNENYFCCQVMAMCVIALPEGRTFVPTSSSEPRLALSPVESTSLYQRGDLERGCRQTVGLTTLSTFALSPLISKILQFTTVFVSHLTKVCIMHHFPHWPKGSFLPLRLIIKQ